MDLFDLDAGRGTPPPVVQAWSFWSARVLQVAVRLGLFTVLDEQAHTAGGLAQQLGSDPAMTERLLVALAALGLVSHDEGRWQNSLPATLYLVAGQPLYQGDAIAWAAEVWNRYHRLEELVRQGRQGSGGFSLEPEGEAQARYLRALHNLAVAGRAQRLARLLPLAGRRTLLDVGGAPGTYSVALCQRFPALHITLLDTASALAEGAALFQPFAGTERITLQEGEWRSQRYGRNEYEALLLSRTLGEREDQVLEQLMRAYEALKAQGLLIVQGHLLDNDLNGGEAAAQQHLLGHACTLDQLRALVAEAGFERAALLFRHAEEGDVLIAYKPDDAAEEPAQELMEFISPEQEIFALMGLGEDDGDGLSLHRRAWERVVRPN